MLPSAGSPLWVIFRHQQLRNGQGSLLVALPSFLFLLRVSDEFSRSGGRHFPRVRRPVPLVAA